jgi:hypothetical protein
MMTEGGARRMRVVGIAAIPGLQCLSDPGLDGALVDSCGIIAAALDKESEKYYLRPEDGSDGIHTAGADAARR